MNHLDLLTASPLETIRRIAATVAQWHDEHAAFCTWPHSLLALVRRQSIPLSYEQLEAGVRQLVASGEIQAWQDTTGSLQRNRFTDAQHCSLLTCHFVWRENPTRFAAPVPPCPSCGQQKDLYMPCGGITYGEIGKSGLFMTCPFAEYGCVNAELRWTCCRCVSLWQHIFCGASVAEIDAAIADLRKQTQA